MALSQSLAAVTLPSGGKFVNGTGSIAINGNTMEITGKDTNHVIAWGGGFNIGKGYTVDFTTENLNYLNLDYTNKASQILGTLNGRTNSVYIVNPSGVLIGEGATINANKFGVSTTPMDINEINDFSNYGSFSPAFNTSKGDVVNMGTINADEIVLVGNKVENIKGTLQSKDQDFADQVTIEGNKVYLEGSRIKATNLDATIESEGFYRYEAKELDDAVKLNGKLLEGYKFTTKGDFKKYLYIGKESATNDQMIDSWTGFTNLFNEGKLQEWEFNDIYLNNNIDFVDYEVEMKPIGDDTNPFTANFYGNGYRLSNLKIKPSGEDYVGLFGYIDGGGVQDLTIDGLKFSPEYFTFFYKYIGGLAGYIANGTFSNITLINITGEIYSAEVIEGAGGFAGYIGGGDFDNIALNGIEDFNNEGIASGGFAGEINTGNFNNISLSNLGNIGAGDYAGGFAGKINDGIYSNIAIDTIKENTAEGGGFSINAYNFGESYAGGFAGYIKKGDFDNIALSDIKGLIQANKNSGGFAGQIDGGDFDNIALSDIKSIDGGSNGGGFVGYTAGNGNFNNIVLSRMGSIHGGTTSGGFAGNIYAGDGEYFNIILNNIQDIGGNGSAYAGGFAGLINQGGVGKYKNIILNNIKNIGNDEGPYVFTDDAGGFAGYIMQSGESFSNIILNNIGAIKSVRYTGGFGGQIDSLKDIDMTFSNIVLNDIKAVINKYNSTQLGGFSGKLGPSGLKFSDIYINSKMGDDKITTGLTHSSTPLDLSNDLTKLEEQSGISGLEYFTNASGDSYLHMVTNGNVGGEDSEITFDEENFTYNTPDIPEINPDGSGTSPLPEVPNEEKLSDVVVGKDDFNGEILNSILGGTSLEFDLLSGDLESIRQSLDFLTAFLKDENTVNDYFDYIPNDNYDSDVHVKFKDNLQVFIENAIQDKDLDLDFLKDYRASLEKYNNDKKLYESGLLHPELQASLEKDLEKQYAELLGSKDKVDSMLEIFGAYKLILDKDKTIFTGNGSNLKFKVGIGELVNYKNTEGGGENNNNFNPPSDLSKQTELSSKEPILVLPAEETQSVIDEGERELGRVCIVSDNAKTSNPCIAIAF